MVVVAHTRWLERRDALLVGLGSGDDGKSPLLLPCMVRGGFSEWMDSCGLASGRTVGLRNCMLTHARVLAA